METLKEPFPWLGLSTGDAIASKAGSGISRELACHCQALRTGNQVESCGCGKQQTGELRNIALETVYPDNSADTLVLAEDLLDSKE